MLQRTLKMILCKNLGNNLADQAIYSLIQQSFCTALQIPCLFDGCFSRDLVFVLSKHVDNDTSVKCYEGKISQQNIE